MTLKKPMTAKTMTMMTRMVQSMPASLLAAGRLSPYPLAARSNRSRRRFPRRPVRRERRPPSVGHPPWRPWSARALDAGHRIGPRSDALTIGGQRPGYVALAFDEIRRAGASSPQILRRLAEALDDPISIAPHDRRAALERQRRLLGSAVEDGPVGGREGCIGRARLIHQEGDASALVCR